MENPYEGKSLGEVLRDLEEKRDKNFRHGLLKIAALLILFMIVMAFRL